MKELNKTFLMENEAIKLLKDYHIPYPKSYVAKNIKEVKELTKDLNYPLVMKVLSPQIIHKSEYGGVILNIQNSDEAEKAYNEIVKKVKAKGIQDIFGVLICEQAEAGVELIIGGTYDDIFGPVLMFGMGGIFVEVLKDVSFRVCPINEDMAMEMISEIKAFPILSGVRGEGSINLSALAKLLSTVSVLITDNTDIREVDLNPVRAYRNSIMVLDARIAVIKK